MARRPFKVLAIDDNSDNLITIRALIMEAFADATVLTATYGRDGLELARKEDPDVILLDIVMPGMDGFAVCQALKSDKALRYIPVVFVTALKADKANRIRALEVGGEGFLHKPIDASELVAQISVMAKLKDARVQEKDEKQRLEVLVQHRTAELEKEFEERKKREKDLRETQRLAKIGSWRLNVATNQVVWSEELYRMYGADPSRPPPLYTESMKLFTPESWERLSAAIANTIATKVPYELELTTVKKDGSNGWMWACGKVVVDSEGKVVEVWGATQDLTERKKADEQFREISARLKHATTSAKAGVWDWNLESGEMIWDDRMMELYGITRATFPGGIEAWTNGLHPDDSARALEECQAAIRGERKFDTQFCIRHPDGTERYIRANGLVLRDKDENLFV